MPNHPSMVVLCEPTHFEVAYSINPWMDPRVPVDVGLARQQWDRIHDLLSNICKVEVVRGVVGLPDMTFAGDCGLAIGNRFLTSRFRHAERQPEAAHYAQWFAARGYEVFDLPERCDFEGLGDVVLDGASAVLGHGFRSSRGVADRVRELFPALDLRCELELVDPRFYHAGLAVTLLGGESVLCFRPALSESSFRALTAAFSDVIEVGVEDATTHFSCNCVVAGHRVLTAGCSRALEDALDRRGYEVVRVEMSEFHKSGASVRCLVMDVY